MKGMIAVAAVLLFFTTSVLAELPQLAWSLSINKDQFFMWPCPYCGSSTLYTPPSSGTGARLNIPVLSTLSESNASYINSIDFLTGKIEWSHHVYNYAGLNGGKSQSLTMTNMSGGKTFVMTGLSSLLQFDLFTGELIMNGTIEPCQAIDRFVGQHGPLLILSCQNFANNSFAFVTVGVLVGPTGFKVQWSSTETRNGPEPPAAPTLVNGTMIEAVEHTDIKTGQVSFVLAAIDVSSGVTMWRSSFGFESYLDWQGSPYCVGNGRVFAYWYNGVGGTLIAIDMYSGNVAWEVPVVNGSAAYDADVQLVLGMQSNILLLAQGISVSGFDGGSGALLWQSTLQNNLSYAQYDSVTDAFILATYGDDAVITSFDASQASGEQEWEIANSPAINFWIMPPGGSMDNVNANTANLVVLYGLSSDPDVYENTISAVDKRDGSVVWIVNSTTTSRFAGFELHQNMLVVLYEGHMDAFYPVYHGSL